MSETTKRQYSGHHVMKVAYRNGWKKRRPDYRSGKTRPWVHPELGTLEGSGTYNAFGPWVHRDPEGRQVAKYPRMIDALFALHPDDPEAP